MKKIIKLLINILRPFILIFLSLFFDRRYLAGRHFWPGYGGFIWAFRAIWVRNILHLERPFPWPLALTCRVSDPRNIVFHPDDLNNFQSPGTYFQNFKNKIRLGRGCYIAPNVGIITANHDLVDLNSHSNGADVVIGDRCWVGMNATILPGVVLGPVTIVAAGAVVTKSFPDGYVVIAGVPAKSIRSLRLVEGGDGLLGNDN